MKKPEKTPEKAEETAKTSEHKDPNAHLTEKEARAKLRVMVVTSLVSVAALILIIIELFTKSTKNYSYTILALAFFLTGYSRLRFEEEKKEKVWGVINLVIGFLILLIWVLIPFFKK